MTQAQKLNDIQAQWMALDCNDTQKNKDKVFTAMKALPKTYLSLSADRKSGVVMNQGQPCQGHPIDIGAAMKFQGIDKTVAWHGETGTWINI